MDSLSWSYIYQGKTMDELRYSLLYTTLELETTRLETQEEIKRREDQVIHLKDLLNRIIKERDEAQDKCQRLLMEKLLLLQQPHQPPHQTTPLSGLSSISDETRRGDSNNGISSSDCEESIVSSPVIDPIMPPPTQTSSLPTTPTPTISQLTPEKPLPEKGKFLQAVMKAGPLLQTLLLAGPLPQWRHPPPLLDSIEIPPVTIPSPPMLPHFVHHDPCSINISNSNSNSSNNNGINFNQKKISLTDYEGSHSSNNIKYQRIALH